MIICEAIYYHTAFTVSIPSGFCEKSGIGCTDCRISILLHRFSSSLRNPYEIRYCHRRISILQECYVNVTVRKIFIRTTNTTLDWLSKMTIPLFVVCIFFFD